MENKSTTYCSSLPTSTFIIIHQLHRTFFGDITNSTMTSDTQFFFVYTFQHSLQRPPTAAHDTRDTRLSFSLMDLATNTIHADKKQNARQTRRSRLISIQLFLHELYLTGILLILVIHRWTFPLIRSVSPDFQSLSCPRYRQGGHLPSYQTQSVTLSFEKQNNPQSPAIFPIIASSEDTTPHRHTPHNLKNLSVRCAQSMFL